MAGNTHRLSKVAGELNVGIPTLLEFLNSKGVKIDSNPNSKLAAEHYEMLCDKFSDDQTLKEKSKLTQVKKEKRETISLRDNKIEEKKIDIEDSEDEIDLEAIEKIKLSQQNYQEPTKSSPEISTIEEHKEVPIEDVPENKEPDSENSQVGDIKVLGKIDLDKINSKTRPDKKTKEEYKKEHLKPKSEAVIPPPIVEKDTPLAEKEEVELPKEIEMIRAERKVLSGPTVLGRIELPAEKLKSAGQSTRPQNDEPRKKRKRIKKVDASKPLTPSVTTDDKSKKFDKNKPPQKNIGTPRQVPAEKDIQKEIKDTLARLSNKGGKSKGSKNRRVKRDSFAQKREMEAMEAEMQEKVLKLTEFVTVSELASMMNVSPTQVISACMSLGIFASINQRLDAETIQIVAEEFEFETEFVSAEVQEAIVLVEDKEEDLIPRPPIITVMGHVDHGKTSLLDKIRNADVTSGEAGGITQHIGAYSVTLADGRKMTFLDTPGHEAFTAMRARGAQVTDVAIIIVAADDDVMPQTKEAISHAQAAGVPMVFAINKIDKDGANPDKIREQLSAMNILVEEWGGKYQCQEISAKKGLNLMELLDKVLLEAELLGLRANPNKNALGTVIESSLDKGKGFVTNILVEEGTLKIGDIVLVGRHYGKVRAMHDERGNIVKIAPPATPVSILGIGGAPNAGDKFHVLNDEREARTIASKREQLYREQGLRTTKHITLDEIGRRLAIGDFKELNLIIKGDVDGSIEALSDALMNLSTEQIAVKIVHKGVGAITEADINLASASDAIIIGFQVRPSVAARKLAEAEQIDIRLYSIIYKAIEEIKSAMEGMLSPEIEDTNHWFS
jgi:translation initiation factor IF-2